MNTIHHSTFEVKEKLNPWILRFLIKSHIEKNGYCIIKPWDNTAGTLKYIAEQIGEIQFHIRSDETGIVGDQESIDSGWKNYQDEYQGVTAKEFLPHTDGSFIDGYYLDKSSLISVTPPRIMLLQCVKQAEEGGVNYVLDSKRILMDILKNDTGLARVLLKPGCISFIRDNLQSLHYPVYERQKDKSFHLRFRYDFATYSPEWSLNAIHILHHEYHMNKKYQINVELKPSEILIVDNFRMLHARTAFKSSSITSSRKMRRIWINDDKKDYLFNVCKKSIAHRAISHYKHYTCLTKLNNEIKDKFRINT